MASPSPVNAIAGSASAAYTERLMVESELSEFQKSTSVGINQNASGIQNISINANNNQEQKVEEEKKEQQATQLQPQTQQSTQVLSSIPNCINVTTPAKTCTYAECSGRKCCRRRLCDDRQNYTESSTM